LDERLSAPRYKRSKYTADVQIQRKELERQRVSCSDTYALHHQSIVGIKRQRRTCKSTLARCVDELGTIRQQHRQNIIAIEHGDILCLEWRRAEDRLLQRWNDEVLRKKNLVGWLDDCNQGYDSFKEKANACDLEMRGILQKLDALEECCQLAESAHLCTSSSCACVGPSASASCRVWCRGGGCRGPTPL